jgi:hypothetical protein
MTFMDGAQFLSILEALHGLFPEALFMVSNQGLELHSVSSGAVRCDLLLEAERIKSFCRDDPRAFWIPPMEQGSAMPLGLNLHGIAKTIGSAGAGSLARLEVTKFPKRLWIVVQDKDGREVKQYDFPIMNLKTPESIDYHRDEAYDFRSHMKSDKFKEICAGFKKTECKDIGIILYRNELQFSTEGMSGGAGGSRIKMRNGEAAGGERGELFFTGVFLLEQLHSLSKFASVCKEIQICFYNERSGREQTSAIVEDIVRPSHISIVCETIYGEARFTLNSLRRALTEEESWEAASGRGGAAGGGGAAPVAAAEMMPPVMGAPGMPALGMLTPSQYISASMMTFPPATRPF